MSRTTSPVLIALGVLALVSACDSAFESGDPGQQGAAQSFQVTFDDGSTQRTFTEADVIQVVLWVPAAGYRNLLPPGTNTVDPGFLNVFTNPGLGGRAPTDDLATTLAAQGLITVGPPSGNLTPLTIRLDPAGPLPVPVGFTVLSASIVDDLGRVSSLVQVQLSVLAADRPTVVLRLEIPPLGTTPTGLLLPTNNSGDSFIGLGLPFVLAFDVVPNPITGSGFSNLLGGAPLDPQYLQVIADQDLGDPAAGGIAAGTNLAGLFGTDLDLVPDPVSGGFMTGALFAANDPVAPPLGRVTFAVTAIDDSGTPSTTQVIALQVDPAISLQNDLMPLFSPQCGFNGCHGPQFPAVWLQLDTSDALMQTAVWVDAFETDENTTCAPWLIEPYSDGSSYLLHKLLGTHIGGCVGGSGQQMPTGGPFWNSSDTNLLATWILQGAFDN